MWEQYTDLCANLGVDMGLRLEPRVFSDFGAFLRIYIVAHSSYHWPVTDLRRPRNPAQCDALCPIPGEHVEGPRRQIVDSRDESWDEITERTAENKIAPPLLGS